MAFILFERYISTKKGGSVYSPKISEDLIPQLYELANRQGIPMTKIVDQLLRPQVIKTKQIKSQNRRNSHGKNNGLPANPNG